MISRGVLVRCLKKLFGFPGPHEIEKEIQSNLYKTATLGQLKSDCLGQVVVLSNTFIK